MASPLTAVKFHSQLASGADNAAGRIFTYAAGTTTLQATYTTSAGSTPNANPVVLDGTGRAFIYLDQLLSYKFVCQDALGAIVPDGIVDNFAESGDPVRADLANSASASKGAGMVAFGSALSYLSGTIGKAVRDLYQTNGSGLVQTPTGTVEARLLSLDASVLKASSAVPNIITKRRRVPAAFVQGDGNTRVDVFPLVVNFPGPGGVFLNQGPLDIARKLGNVIAHELEADIWVAPTALGTGAGDTRANAAAWATAFQVTTTGRRLLMIDTAGPYPPLQLVSGTNAGAAIPKWLFSVDGRVRISATTTLGQPISQTWTLHSGAVYKTNLTVATYDVPMAFLKTLRPNARDGYPDSMAVTSSLAALSALGSSAEGWFWDYPTRTLYATYYNTDLTVSGNRNFQIIYSNKVLDSFGVFSAEWLLGGCTVILEGNFDLDGISITTKEVNSSLPIFMSDGRLRQLCATSYGLRAEGLVFTRGRRCYRPLNDGLNGYKSSQTGTVGMTIEADLVVTGAGDIATLGPNAPHNCQGVSAHGKSNIMLFGALLEGNNGQGWADISEPGHYSASWGVGVITRDNYIDVGVSNGIYMDGSAGAGSGGRSAWLDSCSSEDNTRDLVALSSAIKIYNCLLTTQILTGGGTVVVYAPALP